MSCRGSLQGAVQRRRKRLRGGESICERCGKELKEGKSRRIWLLPECLGHILDIRIRTWWNCQELCGRCKREIRREISKLVGELLEVWHPDYGYRIANAVKAGLEELTTNNAALGRDRVIGRDPYRLLPIFDGVPEESREKIPEIVTNSLIPVLKEMASSNRVKRVPRRARIHSSYEAAFGIRPSLPVASEGTRFAPVPAIQPAYASSAVGGTRFMRPSSGR